MNVFTEGENIESRPKESGVRHMVSYIEQLNFFAEYCEQERLSSYAQLLWYKLVQMNNNFYWKKYFTVSNQKLMDSMSVGTERTLIKARKELTKRGLVKFQRGYKGNPSTYTIVPLVRDKNKLIHPKSYDEDVEFSEIYSEEVEVKDEKTGEVKVKPVERKSKINYTALVEYYNKHRNNMPAVQTISNDRKKKMRARINEHSVEAFKQVIDMAERSNFLNGDNNRGWTANLDWIIRPTNFNKILEGNYENRQPAEQSATDYLINLGLGKIDAAGNPIQQEEEFSDYVVEDVPEEIAEIF